MHKRITDSLGAIECSREIVRPVLHYIEHPPDSGTDCGVAPSNRHSRGYPGVLAR